MAVKEEKTLLGSAEDNEYDDSGYDEEEEEEEDLHSISLEENVFGCLVHKLYTPTLTPSWCRQCFFAALLVSMTLYIQAAFVWAMIPEIAKDELKGKHKNTGFNLDAGKCDPRQQDNLFAEWRCDRDGDGADTSFDGKTPRACDGKEWSFQESQLDNFMKYDGVVESKLMMFFGKDAPRGAIFGTLALILWSATIVEALRSAGEFGTLIWAKGLMKPEMKPETCLQPSVGLKLTVAILAVCRIFVIASLGYYGGKFLSHTDNLKDFIMNSVALAFVLDIPNLFFNAFASAVEKVDLAKHNKEAELKAWVPGVIWIHSGTLSLLIALCLFVFHFIKFLYPFAMNLSEFVAETACFQPTNDAFAIQIAKS